MNNFISLQAPLQNLIEAVLSCNEKHGKWLNTLSYLENCGARKIAACEHSSMVKEEMLKHAAEEFRHAHYLKKQLNRLGVRLVDYNLSSLLGGWESMHYLNRLDLHCVRYLKQHFALEEIKEHAYTLVTYAIELRASELYPLYQQALKAWGSSVRVTSIYLEEKEHLEEMENRIAHMPNGNVHASWLACLEHQLSSNWIEAILKEIE